MNIVGGEYKLNCFQELFCQEPVGGIRRRNISQASLKVNTFFKGEHNAARGLFVAESVSSLSDGNRGNLDQPMNRIES